jgi:diphthamide biosynthesis enzyme Dph1/Dph2-like protein
MNFQEPRGAYKMKILHIPALKKEIKYNPQIFDYLPDKLHILYSIQFKELAEEIAKHLGKRVLAIEQVLGCSEIKPKASLLLIGSGRFHAVNIAYSTKTPVYIYDGKISQITQKDIQEYEKQQQAKLSLFLNAKKIGIIISTKKGQNSKVDISQLRYLYPDKEFYLFLADNINLLELENFSIDFWVNTACPGLELDSKKIINIKKINKN